MSAVTKQEIVKALEDISIILAIVGKNNTSSTVDNFCQRIKQHGIAPSDNVKQADEETHRRVDEAVRDGRIVDKRAPEVKP